MIHRTLLLALGLISSSFAQVSDNFESGWDQTKWPIYAPDCNSGGTVSLDSTTAHSGTSSMKVTSPGGYCGHIFFGTTAVPTGNFYVRVWLKATTALTSNHVSFIVMPDSAQGTGEHIRIGGQDQILMYNRQSSDATLPDLSPDGVASSQALPAGAWECFEYHIGTDGSIATWLNSASIVGLTTPNAYDSGWTSSTQVPVIKGVYFGWESYGGDANTFWYDDIAISSSRVGCAVSGSSSAGGSASATTEPTSSSPNTSKSTSTTSSVAPTITDCSAAKYAQCGGTGFTGCGACASGSTCSAVSPPYYSQCL